MQLWHNREQSQIWLTTEMKNEAKIIQVGFNYLNTTLLGLEEVGRSEDDTELSTFAMLCAITIAKSGHFLLASYSLILDGLAQESGAILRPLIESYEKLVYIRLDPQRAIHFLKNNPPSPGQIAREIEGKYKGLRDHLSKNASHFEYGLDSVAHLVDSQGRLRLYPAHSSDVLRRNLGALWAFQAQILIEATSCLFVAGLDANGLADEVEIWRDRGGAVFKFNDN